MSWFKAQRELINKAELLKPFGGKAVSPSVASIILDMDAAELVPKPKSYRYYIKLFGWHLDRIKELFASKSLVLDKGCLVEANSKKNHQHHYQHPDQRLSVDTRCDTNQSSTPLSTPLSTNNKNNKKEDNKGAKKRTYPPASNDPLWVEFGQFWKVYPDRNGRKLGKKQAWVVYSRLSKSKRELVNKTVGTYADFLDGAYPKDACRYISKDVFLEVAEWMDKQQEDEKPKADPNCLMCNGMGGYMDREFWRECKCQQK